MRKLYLLTTVFLLLTACQPTGPQVPLGVVTPPLQHTNRIVVLDRNVANAIFFVNADQQRLPGGQLFIRVNFQNRYHQNDVWADIKMEFQDSHNMMVDETEWVKTYFPAGEVTMVQGTSISPNAVKHVVLMKNLRTRNGGRITGPDDAIFVF